MKNLEKFGVQELGTQEIRVVNGGVSDAQFHPCYEGSEDCPILLDEVVVVGYRSPHTRANEGHFHPFLRVLSEIVDHYLFY